MASERMVGSELSESDTRALLQEAPRRHGAQIQELLLAALGEALESWSGPGDALVEVEGHGREEDLVGAVDVTRTVGWFTTQYPVLLRGQRGGGVVRRLERVKEDVRGIPRRGLGYGLLRYMSEDEELSRALAAQPAPEVRFNYLGQFDQVLAPEGRFAPAREWTGAPQPREARRTHLIDVTASVSEAKLRLLWRYSDNLHLRHSVEALAGEYIKALQEIIHDDLGLLGMQWHSVMQKIGTYSS